MLVGENLGSGKRMGGCAGARLSGEISGNAGADSANQGSEEGLVQTCEQRRGRWFGDEVRVGL